MRLYITLVIAWLIWPAGVDATLPRFVRSEGVEKSNYRVPRYSKAIMEDRLLDIEQSIDLQYNKDIRRLIHSYVINGRKTAETILGHSASYFPVFEYYLDLYQLPEELKYLTVVESHLEPKAKSPVGAAGLWQIMPKTARSLGLKINNYVDERFDLHKSTDAATRYLSELYMRYQDWTLAIAAYNCGPGPVNTAIKKAKSRSFWKLRKYLPKETQGYVPKFIAAKYVMHYYMFYDLRPAYPDYNMQVLQVTRVMKRKSFAQIEEETGIERHIIERLNPTFRRKIIPPSADGYLLVLPRVGVRKSTEIEYLGYLSTHTLN